MLLLESSLIKQYGDGIAVNDCCIRTAIRDACHEFADARLRDFLPILVERNVRRKLAQRSTVCAHASDNAAPRP
jgi:hypothetical protein